MNSETKYALVVSGLRGDKKREDEFLNKIVVYGNQLSHIILNGDSVDIAAGTSLETLYRNVCLKMQIPTEEDILETYDYLTRSLHKLLDVEANFGGKSQEEILGLIKDCKTYQDFVMWVIYPHITRGRRQMMRMEMLLDLSDFLEKINEVKPEECQVIYNTGEAEEDSPFDYYDQRAPFAERVGREIESICKGRIAIFNDGYMRINRTAIIGATAVADAGNNNICCGMHADQVICHFGVAHEYYGGAWKGCSLETLRSAGVYRWIRNLGANYIWHGHLDGAETEYGYSYMSNSSRKSYVCARNMKGGYRYALIQL